MTAVLVVGAGGESAFQMIKVSPGGVEICVDHVMGKVELAEYSLSPN